MTHRFEGTSAPGDSDHWRSEYEAAKLQLNDSELQVRALRAQVEELSSWRRRYEPAVASRGWRLMEMAWRVKGRVAGTLARPPHGNDSIANGSVSNTALTGTRLEDGWDYEVEGERHLIMGHRSYFKPRVIVFPGDVGNVVVGNYTSIFYDVDIFAGGNHTTQTVSTYAFRQNFDIPGRFQDGIPSTKGDVRIGNDVWIGKGAMILSGVTIGDGAIVGARAVVSRDVPPYAVVVGNPARQVKMRFPDEIVAALMKIQWWHWPEPVIRERIDELSGGSVEDFVARYS